MSRLPTGTVTLLFTDIESSTFLLQQLGERYGIVLEQHRQLLSEAAQNYGGVKVDMQGDSALFAFASATDAVAAAIAAQSALFHHSWPEDGQLRVRMGLHTGEPACSGHDYVGIDVHRGARIMAAAHGGQVLLSGSTRALSEPHLPHGTQLLDMGEHRLKDISRPCRLYHLVIAALPSAFPPLKSFNNRPNNLPSPVTSLIGREAELEEVCALLRRADVRLVTLTGTGGAGKTRLSLQVGEELLADCENGVFIVLLAAITDPDLVAHAVVQALRAPELPGRSLEESLYGFVGNKRMLLLLDNFEQVLDAAPFVARLLAACPLVKVLATSRAPLHLRGERELPVPSLALPARLETLPVETLTQFAAVRLFVERAQAIKANFAVNSDNAPAVAEICARLDGLPLAIELASARIRLFSPQDILVRLENRLQPLTGGARDLPLRHQTLRNSIAWSYDLLSAREQTLFRRLSVFAGSCSLEAIAQIAAATLENEENGTSAGSNEDEILEVLLTLIDHSLLRQADSPAEARYVLLETIRDFGVEQLAAHDEMEATRRKSSGFFLALAQQAEPLLMSAQQAQWLERLETEYDNLMAALSWWERNEVESGLELAVALWPFWLRRGRFSIARQRLQRLLEKSDAAAPPLRARALYGAGRAAWFQADYTASRAFLNQSLALNRELDQKSGIADSLYGLGFVEVACGEHEAARALLEESLALKRNINDSSDLDYIMAGLVILAETPQQLAQCRALLEESLIPARQFNNMRGIGLLLFSLASTAYFQGDYDKAWQHFEESRSLLAEVGDQWASGRVLWGLGGVARAQGRFADAHSHYAAAIAIHQKLDSRWELCQIIEFVAFLRAEEGQPQRAALLLGALVELRRIHHFSQIPAVFNEHRHYDELLRAALPAEAFDAAWNEGQTLPLESVLEIALMTEG